jgi:flagellar motility protein MotE (MotC chaperone)
MRVISKSGLGAGSATRVRRSLAVLAIVFLAGFSNALAAFAGGRSDWSVTITLGDQTSSDEKGRGFSTMHEANPRLMVAGALAATVERPPPTHPPARQNTLAVPQASGSNSLADNYCMNIADAAKSAWIETQKQSLADAEKQLDIRMTALEAKTAEHKLWLGKREEFAARAKDGLLKIYGRMRPDAAAAQLLALDDLTAAAILSRLDPKIASQVMAEMDAPRAARLSATMVGAAGLSGVSASANPRGPKP